MASSMVILSEEPLLRCLCNHLIIVLFFSQTDSKIQTIEYLVERGSDTEFPFKWGNSFWLGYGNTEGSTMDFILAIQNSHPNFFLHSEVCNYILIIISFKQFFSSVILKY
jgi:hypothetical protein